MVLSLEWNNLSALPSQSFQGFYSLENLDLSFNTIFKLDAGYFMLLDKLQYLNVSHSQIVDIEMGSISPLKELETLDLSYNRLKSIDFHLFQPTFRYLKALHLDGNQLTELSDQFDDLFPNLNSLIITNNHFNCTYLSTFVMSLNHIHAAIDTNPATNETNIGRITCRMNEGKKIENGAVKLQGNTGKITVETGDNEGNTPKSQQKTDVYTETRMEKKIVGCSNTLTNVLLILILIVVLFNSIIAVYDRRSRLSNYYKREHSEFDWDMTTLS